MPANMWSLSKMLNITATNIPGFTVITIATYPLFFHIIFHLQYSYVYIHIGLWYSQRFYYKVRKSLDVQYITVNDYT